ncbi:MAG: hypothetical protein HRT58_22645 [Crocinitomicaceae bacterium]|nr:hypothetical protein [Flavobacteriales bacterium]NQZ38478.1 hypothetical protein [Crocinitomicaceae bacterium]
MKDITWFKKEVEPLLKGYSVEYKFFENGDFGDLNQVEFNSKERGGEIDFWSSGWLGVHLVDYKEECVLLNTLLKPNQYEEKDGILNELIGLL